MMIKLNRANMTNCTFRWVGTSLDTNFFFFFNGGGREPKHFLVIAARHYISTILFLIISKKAQICTQLKISKVSWTSSASDSPANDWA